MGSRAGVLGWRPNVYMQTGMRRTLAGHPEGSTALSGFAELGQEGVMGAGKGAAAEAGYGYGAEGFVIREADVGAAGFFVDGHFGNNGDAHADGDHAEQAAELTTFEDDLGMKARAVAGGKGCVAEAVAVAQQKKWFGAKVFQGQRILARESMVFWERGEEGLGENREGFKFVTANRKRDDSQVDGAGMQAFEQHGGDFLDDGDVRLRKFSREARQVRWQEIGSDGGNYADCNVAAQGIFLLIDVAASGFEFTKDGAGAGKKGLAGFGEAHGAAEAIEKAGAQFVFEFADLLREGGLGDVRLPCGAGEAAGVDDRAEVAELVKFHG
jgi:hypothetical protein